MVNGACSCFRVQEFQDCMTSPAEGEYHDILGLQPANCPRSGDHWIVYEFDQEDGKWRIQLIPKSEKSVMLDVGSVITPLMSGLEDSVSCVRSADDTDTDTALALKRFIKYQLMGLKKL